MERTEAERKAHVSLILGIVGLFVGQLVLGPLALLYSHQARAMAALAAEPVPMDAVHGRRLGIIAICIGVVLLVAALLWVQSLLGSG